MVRERRFEAPFDDMRVISFSLYGTEPRYLIGAVENAKMVVDAYPGWERHFWVSGDVPHGTVDDLASYAAYIHDIPSWCKNGMFSRFLAHDLPGVERYICRDVDSRPSEREVKAVEEWIKSGAQLHILRDHPFHNRFIFGGMWGWRKTTKDFKMESLIRDWKHTGKWGDDCDFLETKVTWRSPTILIHDSCGTYNGHRLWLAYDPSFVGEYFDERNRFNQEHRKIRWNHLFTPKATADLGTR